MGYSPAPERLFPGEAPFVRSVLPWAFMREEDRQFLVTKPNECADCGMDDLQIGRAHV